MNIVLFKVQATQMVDMTRPTSTSQPGVCAYVCVLTYSKCFFRCTGSSLHKLGRLRHPLSAPMHTHRYWRVMMCGRQRGSLLSDGCDVSPHPSKTLIPSPPSFLFSLKPFCSEGGGLSSNTLRNLNVQYTNEWLSLAGPMALLQGRMQLIICRCQLVLLLLLLCVFVSVG